MSIIKAIITIFTAMVQLIVPSVAKLAGEESFFTEWSAEEAYSSEKDYIVALEKNPDKDFVVLNLADVQLNDGNPYAEEGKSAEATLKKLIEDTNPDLITLSGDNATGVFAYIWLIQLLDGYNIPWAPVMGNHEGQGLPDEFWAAYELANAKNSLFKFGPRDMGYGNYIINITENGKIIHTLFMLDSHNEGTFTTESGEQVSGYDNVWQNQIDWYKWAINGIAAETGNIVESTVIMHIPLVQYRTAYELALSGGDAVLEFGARGENECPSPVDNGFFAAMKEMGSTRNVIVGHDHVNDYSVVYEGIRLAYGLKTGYGSYNDTSINGGSTLTIGSDGSADFASHYVNLEG